VQKIETISAKVNLKKFRTFSKTSLVSFSIFLSLAAEFHNNDLRFTNWNEWSCLKVNLAVNRKVTKAGLPDFSWYKIPKRKNIPNYHQLYQMSIKYNKRP
jgi:hypothetical protein